MLKLMGLRPVHAVGWIQRTLSKMLTPMYLHSPLPITDELPGFAVVLGVEGALAAQRSGLMSYHGYVLK